MGKVGWEKLGGKSWVGGGELNFRKIFKATLVVFFLYHKQKLRKETCVKLPAQVDHS